MTHDMTTIVQPLNLLVSDELDRASKIHGETFASTHEGFGVIAEEVNESGNECKRCETGLRYLIDAIQRECNEDIADISDQIRDAAVNAAAEMIQVAAMAEKMTRTVTG